VLERFLLFAHAAHDRLGERLVGALEALVALHLLEHVAARKLPGVERLQRHFARLAARALHLSSARCRAISSATRTASAPLSSRARACASSFVVRMPLPTGRPYCRATSMTPRADSLHT